MTKQPLSQEASEAWQNVVSYWGIIKNHLCQSYSAAEVDKARAADAQQIAALKELQQMTLANEIRWMQKWEASEQQIAALRAENEQTHEHLDRALASIDTLEAQLTALQAEQAQWQTWGIIEIAVRNVNVASYMNHWEGRALKAEAQLAALTAQQETPK